MTLAVEVPSPLLRTPNNRRNKWLRARSKCLVKTILTKMRRKYSPKRKRPESGRYLLQVDKQTKDSYKTSEAAQSAALEIKKAYPIVQVSIYDSVDNSASLIELPGAAS